MHEEKTQTSSVQTHGGEAATGHRWKDTVSKIPFINLISGYTQNYRLMTLSQLNPLHAQRNADQDLKSLRVLFWKVLCVVVESEEQFHSVLFCHVTLRVGHRLLPLTISFPLHHLRQTSGRRLVTFRVCYWICCLTAQRRWKPVVPVRLHPRAHRSPAELQQDVSPERLMAAGHQPFLV